MPVWHVGRLKWEPDDSSPAECELADLLNMIDLEVDEQGKCAGCRQPVPIRQFRCWRCYYSTGGE